jgi:hypothetical protein
MRLVTQATTDAWKGSVKAGATRPVVRATIEWGMVRDYSYNTDDAQGGELDAGEMGVRSRRGIFRSILFNNDEVRELPNVRNISWSRSVDQDIAECTLTLLNTDIRTDRDEITLAGDDFDLPGLLTFSRGVHAAAVDRWGYARDRGWKNQIVPDRLVRTYEGYGSDPSKPPGEDPNLYASGVWMIDSVEYNANGDIQLRMRDVGRLLTDHIVFPPVVPRDDYPLEWSQIRTEMVTARDAQGGSFKQPAGTATSSNALYVGKGVTDEPEYLDANGLVQGHKPEDAWIAGGGTGNENYWLSTGQTNETDKVWWQIDLDDPVNLAALKVSTRSGPYRVYVSVHNGEKWVGKRKIPYEVSTGDVDLDAGIKYVHSFKSEHGFPNDITLPRKYGNVTKVRLTFTRLRKLIPATNHPWRAGLRNLALYTAPSLDDLSFGEGEVATQIGNYRDFSQIVRWVGAWAGFYWPPNAWLRYETDGVKHDMNYDTQFVSALPRGRTFGSFEWNGTAGEADITADQFDKQPLLDVISHVREITGCLFFIDEVGSMVYRQPNLWEVGNYVTPSHHEPDRSKARTQQFVTIDEDETLLQYSTTLSSENIRERVFIGDANGKYGVVVKGYRPIANTNLMRIAGWTDGNWRRKDALPAADLIVARQMFDYRRADITIPGYPAIQIDDQIRVFERVTAETFFHYVLGVSSELDMDEGTWTYNLETHWLGPDRDQAFVMDVAQLDGVTQQYLDLHGGID